MFDADEYEWDPDKDLANRRKHGVSFQEAETACRDRQATVVRDLRHADAEERYLVFGISRRGRLLFVVTAPTSRGTIRIISARRATKRERHAYEDR